MPSKSFNFIRTLQYGSKRLTRIITQPFHLGYRRVAKAVNPTGLMTQAMGDVRKGFKSLITTRPSSLKDYFLIGQYYIAKILLLVLILLSLLFPIAYMKLLHPFLVSKLFTKEMYVNTEAMNNYSGKVRLLSRSNHQVIFLGRLQEGRISGDGQVFDIDGNLVYRGEFLNEMFEGEGELFYPDGTTEYKGGFAANQYEGKGKLYYESGALQYEGEFSEGFPNGAGKEYHENGQVRYTGTFVMGKYSGAGAAYMETGLLLYEGGFLNGKADGGGVLHENGGINSEGNFVSGRLTGMGKLYENNELLYDGELLEGKMSGKGRTFSGEDVVYDGEFAENTYNGSGKLYDAVSKSLVYDGEFSDGKFSGNGRYFDIQTGQLVYEGGFFDGVYDGEGKLYDPASGEVVYEGGFHLGRLEGEGTLYDTQTGFPIYEGGFRNGLYDGEGREYNSRNGALLYEGRYLLGQFNDKGTLYDPETGAVLESGIFRGEELAKPLLGDIPAEQMPQGKVRESDIQMMKEEALRNARASIPAIVLPNMGESAGGGKPADGAAQGDESDSGPDAAGRPQGTATGTAGLLGQFEVVGRAGFAQQPVVWPLAEARLLVYDNPAAKTGITMHIAEDGRIQQVDQWDGRSAAGVGVGMAREEIEKALGAPIAGESLQIGEARMISISQSNRFHGRITNLSAQSQVDSATYQTAEGALRMIYSRGGECLLIEYIQS